MIRLRNSPSRCRPAPPRPLRRRAGFSVTEMVVVISIIGVLCGIVVVMLTGAFGASQESLARSRVEMLNSALHTWSTVNRAIYFPPDNASGNDELVILRELQYRDPDPQKAITGAPFVAPEYNPATSSLDSDFRIRWTGSLFELVPPGKSGAGLRMTFDASDYTKPFEFPANYKPGSY